MNGYDFDDTIFRSNSMRRFYLFCAVRLPYLFVLFVPVMAVAVILRVLRILDKNKYLFMMEWFIACVPNAEKFAAKFWDKNIKRIKPWYLEQKRDDDVVVSASPYFLINEACKRLGVACIATDLDTHARLHGKHCHGVMKVEMYKQQYGDRPLATYYSDSLTDTPMFKFAQRGYFVSGDRVLLLYENGKNLLPSLKSAGRLRQYVEIIDKNGYYNLTEEQKRKFDSKDNSDFTFEEFYDIFSKTTYSWDFEYNGLCYWMINHGNSCELCCEEGDNGFWSEFSTPQELFESPRLDGKSIKEVWNKITLL